MEINYPNGKPFKQNHPHKAPHRQNPISYGDRGMSLEAEINQSNEYYQSRGIAVIHKKPTPVQIVSVDYPKRSAAVISKAYFRRPSTTDYNGVFRGKYIDFDAKETTSTTAFPLKNFHAHQVKHMKECAKLGGITFALIKFIKANQLFVLNGDDLFSFWDRKEQGGRKSISKKELDNVAYPVHYEIAPLIPYLRVVNQLINDLED